MNIVTKNELEKILKDENVVLVDFFATWCGPCKMLAPVLEELSQTYQGKATIVKVDVDKEQELAGQYGVMSIPTMILFKNGEVVKQVVGFQPKPQIENLINSAL